MKEMRIWRDRGCNKNRFRRRWRRKKNSICRMYRKLGAFNRRLGASKAILRPMRAIWRRVRERSKKRG